MPNIQSFRYGRSLLIGLLLIICLHAFCVKNREERPHAVILILMDTLRADGLGCYGAGAEASPRIDALARRGILFRHAVSPSSRTLPSMMSLLTSTPPSLHGRIYPKEQKLRTLSPDIAILAELLRQEGYRTAAFTEGGYMSSQFGFDRGFDLYREPGILTDQKAGVAQTFSQAAAWLRKNAENRFFLLFHTYQTHLPYEPHGDSLPPHASSVFPEGFGFEQKQLYEANPATLSDRALESIRDLYRGEIRYADRYVGELIALLDELDILDRSLVVFTSDHGEAFFERNHFGHSRTLYEELVRVPLIFHYPESIPSGVVMDHQVSSLDILPTVLQLCGVAFEEQAFFGKSLVPLFSDTASTVIARPAYAEVYRYSNLASVSFRGYKYILHLRSGEGELYRITSDPAERHNLIAQERATAQAMHQMLTAHLQDAAARRQTLRKGEPRGAPDQDLQQRLKNLGYLQ